MPSSLSSFPAGQHCGNTRMYIASKRDTQVKRRRSWSDVSIKRRAICPSRAASKKKKEMSNELYYPARQTQRDAEERASALCVCDGSIDQQKTWRDLLYTKPRQWVSFLQDGGKKKNKRSSFFSALCVRRASEENLYNGCNKPVANTNRSVTLPAIQPFTVSTKKVFQSTAKPLRWQKIETAGPVVISRGKL